MDNNENEKKDDLNNNSKENKTVEEEKKSNINTKPTSIVSNETKPRKWLLVLLIIITIGIVGVLAYKATSSLIESHNKGSWGIFSTFEKQNDIEKKANEIIEQTQEEVKNQREKISKDSFNWDFETYVGTEYDSSVGHLLDKVITNNKKHKDYTITVTFKGITTAEPEAIKNFKKQFQEWHKYEVSLDYDDDGYVNKVTIEE